MNIKTKIKNRMPIFTKNKIYIVIWKQRQPFQK